MKYNQPSQAVTLEQQFIHDYDELVRNVTQIQKVTFPKIMHERPKLDLAVKVLFDEDLTTMIFPKIQEFECMLN